MTSYEPTPIWRKPLLNFTLAASLLAAVIVSVLSILGATFDAAARRDNTVEAIYSEVLTLNSVVARQDAQIAALNAQVDTLTSTVDAQGAELAALRAFHVAR